MRRSLILCALLFFSACSGSQITAPGHDAQPIQFDRYLWQAARSTIAFLPLQSSDPIEGTLETEWGTLRGGTGDRYRIRVEIDYAQIYSRALAVTLRHQVMTDSGYREVDMDGIGALQLAHLIGEEAGQLRLVQNPGN